jgi:folate-dependent phosphoribosylglycinamide formyltransferase PurN
MKKLLIFASGSPAGGGSGFKNLIEAMREGILHAEIVGVVSNYEHGGVREKADNLNVPFIYFPGPWTAEEYQKIAEKSQADFFALSGWIKPITGLNLNTRFNSKTVFNIHPGPLPKFGGKGMYGHHVHEAVLEAFQNGKLISSEVCMHFVTEEYDQGPVFFRTPVPISLNDTTESLGLHVNIYEHMFQPMITDLVVTGHITWDGINPETLNS